MFKSASRLQTTEHSCLQISQEAQKEVFTFYRIRSLNKCGLPTAQLTFLVWGFGPAYRFSPLSRPDAFRTENLCFFSSLASRPRLATSSSLDNRLPRNNLDYLLKPGLQTRLATSSFFLACKWHCNSLAEPLKPGIHPPPSDLILPGHQIASQQPSYLLKPGIQIPPPLPSWLLLSSFAYLLKPGLIVSPRDLLFPGGKLASHKFQHPYLSSQAQPSCRVLLNELLLTGSLMASKHPCLIYQAWPPGPAC